MSGEGALHHRHGLTMTKRLRRGFVTCPVCHADAAIYNSDPVTDMVKDIYVACSNVTCGLTWKMQLAFVYQLSPSGIDHELDLPKAPPEFVRHIYPAGPPGSAAPDPNQFDMFEDEEGDGAAEDEPEPGLHAA